MRENMSHVEVQEHSILQEQERRERVADEVHCSSNYLETTPAPSHNVGTVSGATSSRLGVRIRDGHSVLALSGLLEPEETVYLKQLSQAAAVACQRKQASGRCSTNYCTLDDQMQVCVTRMPTRAAARREHGLAVAAANDATVQDSTGGLPETLSLFLEDVLERVLATIDDEQLVCPSVGAILFGGATAATSSNNKHGGRNDSTLNDDNDDERSTAASTNMVRLFRQDQLVYSPREPAINVYQPPQGQFSMHTDNQALTVLIPLSCGDDVDFSGGGTAFWSSQNNDKGGDSNHPPSLVLIPSAGTVLLFGGTVPHKGLSIETGSRVVFVASFSLRENNK
eukprot:scaffold11493_cov221-Amphora_coffeaeformis.AAC.3